MSDRVTKPLTEDDILTLTAHFQDQHPIMDCDLLSLRALAELQSLRRENERLRLAVVKYRNWDRGYRTDGTALGNVHDDAYEEELASRLLALFAVSDELDPMLQPKEPRDE
jgi:hypothetical protein